MSNALALKGTSFMGLSNEESMGISGGTAKNWVIAGVGGYVGGALTAAANGARGGAILGPKGAAGGAIIALTVYSVVRIFN